MRRRWLTSKEKDVPAFQAPFEIKNKQGVQCDARDFSATNTTNSFVKLLAL